MTSRFGAVKIDVPSADASVQTTEEAAAIMDAYLARTGVTSNAGAKRYLWTDAFAVENELALAERTGDAMHVSRAAALIEQVHQVLGRHRGDDGRSGPLGGGSEEDARAHPTRGGLRIGKPLPERRPDEPYDDELEWERDGQYFHYATHWMSALAHASRATKRPELHVWACELAAVQHRAFVRRGPGRARMFWKASIDLCRPLVTSMGQHDALDGLVTYVRLDRAAPPGAPSLAHAIGDFGAMIDRSALATADPLGLGALLVDAYRLDALRGDPRLARVTITPADLLEGALAGLVVYADSGALDQPIGGRLAFRELGLAIGLAAFARAPFTALRGTPRGRWLHDSLRRYQTLAERITPFWLTPRGRRSIAMSSHRDIDEVMLASAMLPDGYLAPEGQEGRS